MCVCVPPERLRDWGPLTAPVFPQVPAGRVAVAGEDDDDDAGHDDGVDENCSDNGVYV